jgi:hypothetical protein
MITITAAEIDAEVSAWIAANQTGKRRPGIARIARALGYARLSVKSSVERIERAAAVKSTLIETTADERSALLYFGADAVHNPFVEIPTVAVCRSLSRKGLAERTRYGWNLTAAGREYVAANLAR